MEKNDFANRKPPEKWYRNYLNSNKVWEFQEVAKAKQVDLGDGRDYFVYCNNTKLWHVCDGRSGLMIGDGENKNTAILNARESIKTYDIVVISEEKIAKFGLSPRYKEEPKLF